MNLYDILPKTDYNYIHCKGPLSFDKVATPSETSLNCLSFVSTDSDFSIAYQRGCRLFIGKKGINLANLADENISFIEVISISEVMLKVLTYFNPESFKKVGIDATSIIHPTSTVDKTSYIGAYTVIDEDCYVGANCHIGPFVHIEKGVRIQDNTKIISHCYIGPNSQIGKNVKIYPFNSLGAPGFGFHLNKDGTRTRIPQTGRLIIEDSVEIASMGNFDRATISKTTLKTGTKFDAHAHIAHNCTIGSNGAYAAGFQIAGSVTTGSNIMTGGGVKISDHVNVCDNVVLGGKTGVTNDITEPGAYTGFPAQKMKEGMKNLILSTKLFEIHKTVLKIKKHLNLKD